MDLTLVRGHPYLYVVGGVYALHAYSAEDWEPIDVKTKMASSLVKQPVKQELPPKGGYPPIEYARNIPKRGPSGVALFIGGAAVIVFGFYKVIMGNRQRWYVCISFNSCYVLYWLLLFFSLCLRKQMNSSNGNKTISISKLEVVKVWTCSTLGSLI